MDPEPPRDRPDASQSAAAELRQRAEMAFLRKSAMEPEPAVAMTPEEMQRTLHELHVHQIELEMQNEELRRAQAELEAGRARYFDLYDLAPVGYITLDEQGIIRESNYAAAALLGVSRRGLVKQPITRFIFSEDQDIYYLQCKRLLENGHPQVTELRMMGRDSKQFWARLEASVARSDQGVAEFRLILANITDRKQAEEALQSNHDFQRDILNSLPAHIAVLDNNGKIQAVNEQWLKFARANGDPAVEKLGPGADYFEVCLSACAAGDPYANAAVAGIRSVLTGEQKRFSMDYPCDAPDCARWSAMEVVQPSGRTFGAIVAHTDITARKQAEEALRTANQKLRLHFEQTPMGVIEWDTDFRVTQWNPAAQAIFGYTREEALGRHASFIVPEEFRPMVDGIMKALLEKAGGERSTNANLNKDATQILCEWYNTPLVDEHGTVAGIASLVMDITERTEALEMLAWEKGALELIGSVAPLHEVLDRLMLSLEKQLPGAFCSVLLLDEDGVHLRHGAAPSLPDTYNRAIDGTRIGPAAGSCGAAAYTKQQVIVEDIATDPLWADYRELALKHDLRACWSAPIHNSGGKILGTFAIYHREPRRPTDAELEMVERAVHVVRIAVKRKLAEEEIHNLNASLEKRVEERTRELQEANASLSDFKAALDEHALVSITDAAGIITYANAKFCAISKYPLEELIGQDHRIVNSGHHPSAFFQDLWQTVMKGSVWKSEMKNRAKDGSVYWVDTTIVPFLGHGGKPSQFMAIRTDITKRKLAEDALRVSGERLSLATEVAAIGVWERDLKSQMLSWDRRMFEIYGLPENPEGLASYQDWRERLLPEDLAAQESRLEHTIATCGRDQREFRIVRASDHAVRVIQAGEMVVMGTDGQAARMVGINRDITERKRAEEEVTKLNADLQNRAAELLAANKELEAFSYSVSHDLRAPLRAVDGFSRMVLEDYADQLDEDGRRKLSVIRTESQRMGRLIDDLLAFSRLGRQPIEPVEIDMRRLAQGVFDELAARDPGRKLHLDLQPLPPARGSEALVRQVWVNLISNAIKFTQGRDPGEIEIGSKTDVNGEQMYYVKDNGAGFDMRHTGKLFGVFQRLHTQEEFTGTGVGLALAQRIVQRHGGRIWAESEVGHGAAFYFTLPNQNL